jgi:hypothetical protein
MYGVTEKLNESMSSDKNCENSKTKQQEQKEGTNFKKEDIASKKE